MKLPQRPQPQQQRLLQKQLLLLLQLPKVMMIGKMTKDMAIVIHQTYAQV